MDDREEKYYIDRATYKKIKGFSRDQLNSFLNDLYNSAYEEGQKSIEKQSIELDTDSLRSALSAIKGIGNNRLNEIMAAIEAHLNKFKEHGEQENDTNI